MVEITSPLRNDMFYEKEKSSLLTKECPYFEDENIMKFYRCPCCSATNFPDQNKLSQHFYKAHSKVRIIRCWICKQIFCNDFEYFMKHCAMEHSKDIPSIQETKFSNTSSKQECKFCHKIVPAIGYHRHLLSHKPVPCPVCKVLLLPKNVKRHMNDCHTKKLSFQCRECPNIYYDVSNYKSHCKRHHSDQKQLKYLCDFCGKKFISPSDLKIHVAGVHLNIKKFVCEFCGSSYKVASALTYHRRSHTGEKPHVCHVCSQSFAKPNALSRHLKLVHQLEYKGKYRKRRGLSNSSEAKNLLDNPTSFDKILDKTSNCIELSSPSTSSAHSLIKETTNKLTSVVKNTINDITTNICHNSSNELNNFTRVSDTNICLTENLIATTLEETPTTLTTLLSHASSKGNIVKMNLSSSLPVVALVNETSLPNTINHFDPLVSVPGGSRCINIIGIDSQTDKSLTNVDRITADNLNASLTPERQSFVIRVKDNENTIKTSVLNISDSNVDKSSD